MKVTELSASAQDFLEQIKSQMEGDVLAGFDLVLRNLEKLSPEIMRRLGKLQALEDAGVDNWEWYDDALEDWREEEDSTEEDSDD